MMYYFGPWDRAGHFVHDASGYTNYKAESVIPWTLGEMDGRLQPHTCDRIKRGQPCYRGTCAKEGEALIHHKSGWTALAFWDSSVDTRGGCVSVYVTDGTYNFDQMVEMAKTQFKVRWDKMKFPVVEYDDAANLRRA